MIRISSIPDTKATSKLPCAKAIAGIKSAAIKTMIFLFINSLFL
jgi:hypothetical protein